MNLDTKISFILALSFFVILSASSGVVLGDHSTGASSHTETKFYLGQTEGTVMVCGVGQNGTQVETVTGACIGGAAFDVPNDGWASSTDTSSLTLTVYGDDFSHINHDFDGDNELAVVVEHYNAKQHQNGEWHAHKVSEYDICTDPVNGASVPIDNDTIDYTQVIVAGPVFAPLHCDGEDDGAFGTNAWDEGGTAFGNITVTWEGL